MRQPGKLKRWLLRRLGGVPQSEYNIVCEQRDTFIGDLRINDRLIKSLEAENKQLTERLKQVLLSIDTAKEMNAMCNIDEQRKQAVEEFVEELIKKVHNYYPSIDNYCVSEHVVLVKDINKLLRKNRND